MGNASSEPERHTPAADVVDTYSVLAFYFGNDPQPVNLKYPLRFRRGLSNQRACESNIINNTHSHSRSSKSKESASRRNYFHQIAKRIALIRLPPRIEQFYDVNIGQAGLAGEDRAAFARNLHGDLFNQYASAEEQQRVRRVRQKHFQGQMTDSPSQAPFVVAYNYHGLDTRIQGADDDEDEDGAESSNSSAGRGDESRDEEENDSGDTPVSETEAEGSPRDVAGSFDGESLPLHDTVGSRRVSGGDAVGSTDEIARYLEQNKKLINVGVSIGDYIRNTWLMREAQLQLLIAIYEAKVAREEAMEKEVDKRMHSAENHFILHHRYVEALLPHCTQSGDDGEVDVIINDEQIEDALVSVSIYESVFCRDTLDDMGVDFVRHYAYPEYVYHFVHRYRELGPDEHNAVFSAHGSHSKFGCSLDAMPVLGTCVDGEARRSKTKKRRPSAEEVYGAPCDYSSAL